MAALTARHGVCGSEAINNCFPRGIQRELKDFAQSECSALDICSQVRKSRRSSALPWGAEAGRSRAGAGRRN